jgi:hypothetical protein
VAYVYVDGVLQDADPNSPGIQHVDLYSAGNQPRQAVFNKSWWLEPSDVHTVEIVVAGTPGRPWVDVDAFTEIHS